MPVTILVVDDEVDMRHLLKRSLEPELACRVDTAGSGEQALKSIADTPYDLVLADIKMPGMSGIDLLRIVRRDYPDITMVMMTAYGDIDTAVNAIKDGAYDFITKPFDHDTLVLRLGKALERSRLLRENKMLQQTCRQEYMFQRLVGKSKKMRQVFETIQMVAKTDLTVLITGESGTGKELTARAVHAMSPRADNPFLAVNCPTLPENILESELFGYRKGAFTDAKQDKKGLFQEANAGSIFLDEIGDISTTIQTKLLRVLQEKEIKPLGANAAIRVDVRVIASTNQDLRAKMEQREYREDFYYRLNVLPIHLPPLRERREDIPLLANHLLEKHCLKLKKHGRSISGDLMPLLTRHHWEGNVRELENIIIQGILFARGDEITPEDVKLDQEQKPDHHFPDLLRHQSYKTAKEETLLRFNKSFIGQHLAAANGNVTQAAKRCGLECQALQQIMRRYGIKPDPYRE